MATQRRNPNRKLLIEQSKKLKALVDFLNEKWASDDEVRRLVNGKLEMNISEGRFSKLQSLNKKPHYINTTFSRLFPKLFEILEDEIKNKYGYKYTLGQFTQIAEDIHTPRLKALIGTYEAYSWDTNASLKEHEGIIHYFKIQVNDINDIECKTENTSFKSSAVSFIGTDKVSVELTNDHRKVFLIIQIGNGTAEDLKTTNRFYLAYTDSGRIKIKSGLAIIERTDQVYGEIKVGIKKINEYAQRDSFFTEFLKEKQMIVDDR